MKYIFFFSDSLMTEFQEMAKSGDWEANGWPNCAYTVSKVGVNVYTRILQRQFVEEGSGNVVNSIHPGTKHSKIQQQSVIPLEDGAWAIANCACIPDTKGSLRGEVRCCLYFRVFTKFIVCRFCGTTSRLSNGRRQ